MSSGSGNLQRTNTGDEDPGKAAGWSINNGVDTSNDGGTTWCCTHSASMKIAIKGNPVTVPGPPTGLQGVPADWGLIPSGLGVGDSFRLVFISSTTRDASSSSIDDYNTFIQARAAAGHADIQPYSSLFRAVGCTNSTNATANTNTRAADTSVPIFWLNGCEGGRRL